MQLTSVARHSQRCVRGTIDQVSRRRRLPGSRIAFDAAPAAGGPSGGSAFDSEWRSGTGRGQRWFSAEAKPTEERGDDRLCGSGKPVLFERGERERVFRLEVLYRLFVPVSVSDFLRLSA